MYHPNSLFLAGLIEVMAAVTLGAAPPQAPAPPSAAGAGQPRQAPGDWEHYLELRDQAIRTGAWLVVAVNMEPPAGYLAYRCASFERDATPRLIYAYGAQGDLWRHREEPLQRQGVYIVPAARLTFARAASC